jgi:hypothetical protein
MKYEVSSKKAGTGTYVQGAAFLKWELLYLLARLA